MEAQPVDRFGGRVRRRGKTIRFRGRAWRLTIPKHRVKFESDVKGWSAGWLIVTRL